MWVSLLFGLPFSAIVLVASELENKIPKLNFLPPCASKIYCHSDLLHDVQISGIFNDSKTFVDKKLKYCENVIIDKYNAARQNNGNKALEKDELSKFIDENFEDGNELENWTPSDFKSNISLLTKIKDKNFHPFIWKLIDLWKILARKIIPDVKEKSDRYSLIYVPNGFFIPGGRFRELYYWDTYWIVSGLLVSEMYDSAKGVIKNLLFLVDKFGFIPNGSRVYYLNRSQPPLLIQMVNNYYKATKDFNFIKENINLLTKEFEWWQNNRKISFIKDSKFYSMFRYFVPFRGPRPESYREDYEVWQSIPNFLERELWHVCIKSGAETGWDFSSRWFICYGTNKGTLQDVRTPFIIPVDLNAIMQKNAALLSEWWYKLSENKLGKYYSKISQKILSSMDEVLWCKDDGAWFDFDLINKKSRKLFYPSNIAPLWTGSYSDSKESIAKHVIKYLKEQKIVNSDNTLNYYGIPTSLQNSSQQWDYPNAWPPLQAFVIQGLNSLETTEAKEIAFNLAQVWVRSNIHGLNETGFMFEKYNAEYLGGTGGGGEYSPQVGFGWSNGLMLEIFNTYPMNLSSNWIDNDHYL